MSIFAVRCSRCVATVLTSRSSHAPIRMTSRSVRACLHFHALLSLPIVVPHLMLSQSTNPWLTN